ncbi:unnamed protein product [Closterium sp. Naga37s-1]|nr:unnamed protein product [Closterium sp. Naga37s-1]
MATDGEAKKRGELRYAMVSRGVDVLAEHSMVKGDLSATVQECLAVLPKDGAKHIAMPYGDFTIAFQTEKEYVFGVLADKQMPRDVLRGFLDKVRSGFMAKYGSKARAMPAGALQREFGPKLKQQLQQGTARPEDLSKAAKLLGQVEEVKGVMLENMKKVINRGEKLEVLNEQANVLQENVRAAAWAWTAHGCRDKEALSLVFHSPPFHHSLAHPLPPRVSPSPRLIPVPPRTILPPSHLSFSPVPLAPCGHCKKVAPEYERLAAAVKDVAALTVGKVNCEEHKALCDKHSIRSFPTFRWFPAHQTTPENFKGRRDVDDFINFINEKLGTRVSLPGAVSHVVALCTDSFNHAALDDSLHALVMFYTHGSRQSKGLFPMYEKVAAAFRAESSVVVGKVDVGRCPDLKLKYSISMTPELIWFPRHNKVGEVYRKARSVRDLVAFINQQAGTHRTIDGTLSPASGRLPALDDLAQEFMAAVGEARGAVRARAEAEAAQMDEEERKRAMVYCKIMGSIMEQGDGYVGKEMGRLSRLLQGTMSLSPVPLPTLPPVSSSLFLSPLFPPCPMFLPRLPCPLPSLQSLSRDKADQFTTRKNILQAFLHTEGHQEL